jgi:hypothetical protein
MQEHTVVEFHVEQKNVFVARNPRSEVEARVCTQVVLLRMFYMDV